MEENNIKGRFTEFLSYLGIGQGKFEKMTGIGNGTINNIKNGISTPKLEKIIEAYPNLNIEWLITGEGNMLKKEQPETNINLIDNPNFMMVSVVGQYAAAGYLRGYVDEEYIESLPKIPFFIDHDPKGKYMAFEVRGDSMDDDSANSIVDGDTLICREIKPELWRDKLHIKKYFFVIAHKTEGIIVKQIVNHNTKTGDITIHSLNSLYSDRVLNLSDVAQLFNVIQISRKPRL